MAVWKFASASLGASSVQIHHAKLQVIIGGGRIHFCGALQIRFGGGPIVLLVGGAAEEREADGVMVAQDKIVSGEKSMA